MAIFKGFAKNNTVMNCTLHGDDEYPTYDKIFIETGTNSSNRKLPARPNLNDKSYNVNIQGKSEPIGYNSKNLYPMRWEAYENYNYNAGYSTSQGGYWYDTYTPRLGAPFIVGGGRSTFSKAGAYSNCCNVASGALIKHQASTFFQDAWSVEFRWKLPKITSQPSWNGDLFSLFNEGVNEETGAVDQSVGSVFVISTAAGWSINDSGLGVNLTCGFSPSLSTTNPYFLVDLRKQIFTGEWQHVAIYSSGSQVAVFIDGTQCWFQNLALGHLFSYIAFGAGPFSTGALHNIEYFYIDEVRFNVGQPYGVDSSGNITPPNLANGEVGWFNTTFTYMPFDDIYVG